MPAAAERVWTATTRQREFLKATEDEVLYGGAAGGGKTDALLILAALRCGKVAGAHVLYLRREFPDLEMSAIKRSLELFAGAGPTYNASAHRWLWPNGSRLQFGHLQRDEDVYQYQSAEFDLVCFDELTQFSDAQYRYMLSRNRTTKPEARPWMRAATNPGGVGHGWVRDRFVDVAQPGTPWTDADGRTRRFVPARVDDNPHLLAADPGYVTRLAQLPEAQRAALRDGSWDVVEGAAFAEWRTDLHVCEPFDVPPHWQRVVAIDWGYNDPCVALWLAFDADGGCVAYRERTAREIGARQTAREILGLEQGERIGYRVIGGDVEQRRDAETPTIGEMLQDEGLYYTRADMSPGARLQGKQRIHDWLRTDADGRPRLRVFRTCRTLCATLPRLQYDRHHREDVAQFDDHAYDALRYGLMSRPQPAGFVNAHSPSETLLRERRLDPDGIPWALREDDGGRVSWLDA